MVRITCIMVKNTQLGKLYNKVSPPLEVLQPIVFYHAIKRQYAVQNFLVLNGHACYGMISVNEDI